LERRLGSPRHSRQHKRVAPASRPAVARTSSSASGRNRIPHRIRIRSAPDELERLWTDGAWVGRPTLQPARRPALQVHSRLKKSSPTPNGPWKKRKNRLQPQLFNTNRDLQVSRLRPGDLDILMITIWNKCT
jgi:hypothetical protein